MFENLNKNSGEKKPQEKEINEREGITLDYNWKEMDIEETKASLKEIKKRFMPLYGHLHEDEDFISKKFQEKYDYPNKVSFSISQENGISRFVGMAHYQGGKDYEKQGEVIYF